MLGQRIQRPVTGKIRFVQVDLQQLSKDLREIRSATFHHVQQLLNQLLVSFHGLLKSQLSAKFI
jgi:hypothetical protein